MKLSLIYEDGDGFHTIDRNVDGKTLATTMSKDKIKIWSRNGGCSPIAETEIPDFRSIIIKS